MMWRRASLDDRRFVDLVVRSGLDHHHAASACCPLLSEVDMFGSVLINALTLTSVLTEIFVKENAQWPAIASRTSVHQY